jgi:hypothetical protein
VGSSPLTLPVAVFNVGTAPLTISGIPLIATTTKSDFTISAPPGAPIPPGGEIDLTITYTPSGNGFTVASWEFTTNESPNPIPVFTVSATGQAVSGALWEALLKALGLAASTP